MALKPITLYDWSIDIGDLPEEVRQRVQTFFVVRGRDMSVPDGIRLKLHGQPVPPNNNPVFKDGPSEMGAFYVEAFQLYDGGFVAFEAGSGIRTFLLVWPYVARSAFDNLHEGYYDSTQLETAYRAMCQHGYRH